MSSQSPRIASGSYPEGQSYSEYDSSLQGGLNIGVLALAEANALDGLRLEGRCAVLSRTRC